MKTAAKTKPALSWDRVDAARKSAGFAGDAIPDGAITVRQYQAKYGLSQKGAHNQLQLLVGSGAMKCGRKSGTQAKFYWLV